MLTSDPKRPWFIYFNEKEMGPFPENVVVAKFHSGEIDNTAYVYTEGMTDWALYKDTPVLAQQQQQQQQPQPQKSTSTSSSGGFSVPQKSQISRVSQVAVVPIGGNTGLHESSKVAPVPSGVTQTGLGNAVSISASTKTENTQKSVVTNIKEAPSPAPKAQPAKPASGGIFKNLNFKLQVNQRQKVMLVGVLVVLLATIGLQISGFLGTSPEVQNDSDSQVAEETGSAQNTPQKVAKANPEKAQGNPETAVTPAAAPPQLGAGEGLSEAEWRELDEFRANKDTKSAPYRLANRVLGQERPIIVGVVSSLIPVDEVAVAVFPENSRSLMLIPKIWLFKATVSSGYFSVGPLTADGQNLLPGTYNVMVQAADKFLGETKFEVGTWPSVEKLGEINAQNQSKRSELAAQEKQALEAKFKEVIAAFEQLRIKGVSATKGKKGAKEWASFSKSWVANLRKAMSQQGQVVAGPMFYESTQRDLLKLINQMKVLFESYQIVADGGPKALARAKRKDLGKQIADLTKAQMSLEQVIKTLGPIPANTPGFSVTPSLVKITLDRFARDTVGN
jgi:hypothetical protein